MLDLYEMIQDLKVLSDKYKNKTYIQQLINQYEEKARNLELDYEYEFSSDIDLD